MYIYAIALIIYFYIIKTLEIDIKFQPVFFVFPVLLLLHYIFDYMSVKKNITDTQYLYTQVGTIFGLYTFFGMLHNILHDEVEKNIIKKDTYKKFARLTMLTIFLNLLMIFNFHTPENKLYIKYYNTIKAIIFIMSISFILITVDYYIEHV